MAFNETWHVRNRARICAATGERFTEGQPIVTALFPDPESSGYLRKDFCVNAWNEHDHGEEKPFSHWRTNFVPTPINETVPPVTKQSAEDLLRSLVEEDQEHTENTRYILAVMLERQKLLRETDTQATSGGILRIYEHRKTGEVYIVKDPNIPLDQVEKIQEEVILLLSPRPVQEEDEDEIPVQEIPVQETPAQEETSEQSSEPPPADETPPEQPPEQPSEQPPAP